MRVCIVGGDGGLQNQCRAVLEEIGRDDWDLVRSTDPSELLEADLYVWDFEAVPRRLRPEVISRSLFLVDVGSIGEFRQLLGTSRASVVLKPAHAAALTPFFEHAFRQDQPASTRPEALEPGDVDLLEGLLHANLRLQEYDQARTNFLARAAHDFRAPLTALNGYCGLLAEQRLGPLSADQTDLLMRMRTSIKRLSRLAESMFDLSVSRHSKREMEMQPGNLEDCIAQAVHEITPHAMEKQIRVSVDVDSADQAVMFDRGRIEQVLVNLLENACKFTSKNGTIDVAAYPVHWRVQSPAQTAVPTQIEYANHSRIANAYRVDVRDSGCGIPKEHIDTIFEEYTSYAGGKDRSGGGLGLAICRMIIDAHQGGIWAESDGAGSQFSLVLPYRGTANSIWPGGKPAVAAVGAKTLSA